MLGRRRTRYPSLHAFVTKTTSTERVRASRRHDRRKTGAVPLRPLQGKTKALLKSTSPTPSPLGEAQVGFDPL
jgi:hypothetical protein